MSVADCTPSSRSLWSTTSENDSIVGRFLHSSHAKVLLCRVLLPPQQDILSCLSRCHHFNLFLDTEDLVNVSLKCEASEFISFCSAHLLFFQLDVHCTRCWRKLVRFSDWKINVHSSQEVGIVGEYMVTEGEWVTSKVNGGS